MASVTKVNKVYFPVDVTIGAGITFVTRKVLAFNATQATAGFTTTEAFGRFLRDFAAMSDGVGGDPANMRAAKQVRAYFVRANNVGTSASGSRGAIPVAVAVDYIAPTGNATTALGINPLLTRFFRVRAIFNRIVPRVSWVSDTIRGTLVVQRPHSIEV
jgi:hypothetical protein